MESVIGVERAQIGCKRVGRSCHVKAFSQHKACLFLYIVLPYKPNISLIHSILYNKLFAYIYKFLYLYIIILADIYA